jgi:hypothetical protein
MTEDAEPQNRCHTPGCHNPVAGCRCMVCRIYWCSEECMKKGWRHHAEEECYPYGFQVCASDDCRRPAALLCKICRSVCYCSATCKRSDKEEHVDMWCIHRKQVTMDVRCAFFWKGMHVSPGAPYVGPPTDDDVRRLERKWGVGDPRARQAANWEAATDPCSCLGGHVCDRRMRRLPAKRDPSCPNCFQCVCGYGRAHCVRGCPVKRLVRYGVPRLYAGEAVRDGHGMADDPMDPDMCECGDERMGDHPAPGCPNVFSYPAEPPCNGHGDGLIVE